MLQYPEAESIANKGWPAFSKPLSISGNVVRWNASPLQHLGLSLTYQRVAQRFNGSVCTIAIQMSVTISIQLPSLHCSRWRQKVWKVESWQFSKCLTGMGGAMLRVSEQTQNIHTSDFRPGRYKNPVPKCPKIFTEIVEHNIWSTGITITPSGRDGRWLKCSRRNCDCLTKSRIYELSSPLLSLWCCVSPAWLGLNNRKRGFQTFYSRLSS